MIRPSGSVATTLAEMAAELAQLAGPRQLVYCRENLHATVRTFEFHRGGVGPSDPAVQRYGSALRTAARRIGGLAVRFHGVGASREACSRRAGRPTIGSHACGRRFMMDCVGKGS